MLKQFVYVLKRSRLVHSTANRWPDRKFRGYSNLDTQFVHDVFPLEIDRYRASAWTTQTLSALR
jgi:hypothetical protein